VSGGHDSPKAVIAALLANAGIAVMKFVAFVFTGSASMLSEAIHSVADCGNQSLLLLGRKQAQRPPDDTHPFGYGPSRYFWAFVVAIVLFLLGGVFSIFEGVEKIRHPHEVESLYWAVGVLLFAIVLESLSYRTAIRETRPHLKRRSYWRFIRRTKNPELPVVLLEDLGALVGLLIALFGVSMAYVTGNGTWDGVGSLGIGILLVIIAVILVIEMQSLLLGEAAEPDVVAAIAAAIDGATSVRRRIHLRTEHLGPDEIVVAAKVEFDHDLSFDHLADAINGVERAIRAAEPDARLVFIEPDVYREQRADQADQKLDSAAG
jgi:cation diffusion facilitator family transporter